MKLSDYFKQKNSLDETPSPSEAIDWLWIYFSILIETTRTRFGFDANGMARALAWKSDVDCPTWRMARINAVLSWSDQAWMLYYQLRPLAEAGQDFELPENLPAPCPYSFRDLLFE